MSLRVHKVVEFSDYSVHLTMGSVIMSDSRRGIVARVIGIFVVMALLVYTSKGLNSDGLNLLEFKKNILDEFNILGNWNPRD